MEKLRRNVKIHHICFLLAPYQRIESHGQSNKQNDKLHFFKTQSKFSSKVQKMNTNSKSVGICRRLINFILSVLSSLKTPARGSTEVPIEEGSFRNGKSSIRPISKLNGYGGSEIMVEFRHTDGFESWTQIDPKKEGLMFGDEQPNGLHKRERKQDLIPPRNDQRNGRNGNGKEIQDFEGLNGAFSREKGAKKSVTFKESGGEGQRSKKKEASNAADQGTIKENNLSREGTKPRPQRRLGPLLSMASNINEKAAAYIQRKKRDMSRNYTLDPDHKF